MYFDNIRNEFVILLFKVMALLLIMSLVYERYPYDFLQPYNLRSVWDYLRFGFAMLILFCAYLDVTISVIRLLFSRTGNSQLKTRKRYFYWLRDELQIQSAINAHELRRQVQDHFIRYGRRGVMGVANQEEDGSYTWSPNLARHAELIWIAKYVYRKSDVTSCTQGFVDHNGNFLDREEAFVVAVQYNQIFRPEDAPSGTLFSEAIH